MNPEAQCVVSTWAPPHPIERLPKWICAKGYNWKRTKVLMILCRQGHGIVRNCMALVLVYVGPTHDQGFLHVLGGKYFIISKECFCLGVECIVLFLFHLLQHHLGPWHYSIIIQRCQMFLKNMCS